MTKKAIKMKDIILEHYQKVHELEMDGLTVRVWKPRTMQQLPAYNMLDVIEGYAKDDSGWCAIENKAEWFYGNPDWGMWDALLVRYIDPRRKTLDIYFAAILVRPFSREAYDWYNRHHVGLEQMERLMLMWDSREYDRIHGFDQSYGKPSNWEKDWKDRLYVAENEKRDIEDLSPDYFDNEGSTQKGIVFKMRHGDESYDYQSSWPKDEDGKPKMPEKFMELHTAAVNTFVKIQEECPEFREVHFYTEPTEWEDDEEE